MSTENLYEINVLIIGMSRGTTVSGVTANEAHAVADSTAAAWGWTAELEEAGAYGFESGETKIRVTRSA